MRGKSSYPICPGPALSSPTADRGSPGQRGGPEEMGPSSLPPGAISARPGSILTVCACVFCSSCHLPSQQPLRELRERVPAPLRGHPPEERLQPLLRGDGGAASQGVDRAAQLRAGLAHEYGVWKRPGPPGPPSRPWPGCGRSPPLLSSMVFL